MYSLFQSIFIFIFMFFIVACGKGKNSIVNNDGPAGLNLTAASVETGEIPHLKTSKAEAKLKVTYVNAQGKLQSRTFDFVKRWNSLQYNFYRNLLNHERGQELDFSFDKLYSSQYLWFKDDFHYRSFKEFILQANQVPNSTIQAQLNAEILFTSDSQKISDVSMRLIGSEEVSVISPDVEQGTQLNIQFDIKKFDFLKNELIKGLPLEVQLSQAKVQGENIQSFYKAQDNVKTKIFISYQGESQIYYVSKTNSLEVALRQIDQSLSLGIDSNIQQFKSLFSFPSNIKKMHKYKGSVFNKWIAIKHQGNYYVSYVNSLDFIRSNELILPIEQKMSLNNMQNNIDFNQSFSSLSFFILYIDRNKTFLGSRQGKGKKRGGQSCSVSIGTKAHRIDRISDAQKSSVQSGLNIKVSSSLSTSFVKGKRVINIFNDGTDSLKIYFTNPAQQLRWIGTDPGGFCRDGSVDKKDRIPREQINISDTYTIHSEVLFKSLRD